MSGLGTEPVEAPRVPGDRKSIYTRQAVTVWRAIVVAVLVACWELVPRVLSTPSAFVVPLSEAIRTGIDRWSTVQAALWPTISAILVGLLVSWVAGVIIGFVLGNSPRLRFITPVFGSLYAIPFVVMYPLISVWMGPGQGAKILFASLYGFIPVVLTTISAVRSVDESLRRSAVSMGASQSQLLVKVVIPAAMPVVLSGLRLGGGLVLIGVIVGEMLASASGGIGTLITAFRVQFNAGGVYFCILIVLVFALLMDQSLAFLARRFAGSRRPHKKTIDPREAVAR